MNLLSSQLVFAQVEAKTSSEIIQYLAQQLQMFDKVQPDFSQAVQDRELSHPTGLPSGKIAVAIPHTDVEYVKHPAIAFATLKQPIQFHNMAVTKQLLDVQIVVMLALKNPHSQVQMLQKLMTLFQNQVLLEQLVQIQDQQLLFQQLVANF